MKEITSLSDFTMPEEGYVEIPRKNGEDERFPIRALSAGESQEIYDRNRAPAAPKKFDKTGKFTENGKPGWYYDESDPVHQQLVSEKSQAVTYEMAVAAIPIPDLTVDYLKEHLTIGDISLILDAVNDLSNITSEDEEAVKNSSESE